MEGVSRLLIQAFKTILLTLLFYPPPPILSHYRAFYQCTERSTNATVVPQCTTNVATAVSPSPRLSTLHSGSFNACRISPISHTPSLQVRYTATSVALQPARMKSLSGSLSGSLLPRAAALTPAAFQVPELPGRRANLPVTRRGQGPKAIMDVAGEA